MPTISDVRAFVRDPDDSGWRLHLDRVVVLLSPDSIILTVPNCTAANIIVNPHPSITWPALVLVLLACVVKYSAVPILLALGAATVGRSSIRTVVSMELAVCLYVCVCVCV